MQPEQYRESAEIALKIMERDIAQIKEQLKRYEPASEGDLKLQHINEAVGRIENELGRVRDRLEAINASVTLAEQKSLERDNAIREAQDKTQLRMWWAAATAVLTIVSGVLVGYITHFFG